MVAMATVTTVVGAGQLLSAQPAAAVSATTSAQHASYHRAVTSRTEIVQRAQHWVDRGVRYSMSSYYEGYRQDCSGFVSMAWGLSGSQWTGSLASYGIRVGKDALQPGDILLYHNAANPTYGSHVVLFGGWSNTARTKYVAYELTKPHALRRVTPFPYWNHTSGYVAYRSRAVAAGGAGQGDTGSSSGPVSGAFPGVGKFGAGQHNDYVTQLGRMLIQRGGARFYTVGPGPAWGRADEQATAAFQRAQGWRGAEADGIPGPQTWQRLVKGTGNDIPAAHGPEQAGSVPGFPGRGVFRPGQSNDFVTQLGRQLVKKGFGGHYAVGPGPRWSESDRRNVEAFQRAQGWRGGDADGYPGPETWRRLFR